MKPFRGSTLVSLFLMCVFTLALAQTSPANPLATTPSATSPNPLVTSPNPAASGANPLVGRWQSSVELGRGLPATSIFQAQPDGRYREELYAQNQLIGFWEGTYTLAPDGTLTETLTSKSPQVCLQGKCVANEVPASIVLRVSVQGPDAFTVTGQDSTGKPFTIAWQRMNGAANPTAQPGAMPGGVPTYGAPTMPGGAMPSTGVPGAGYPAPSSTGQGDFIDGVIWGESSYVDPNGGTFNLPVVPDPDMTYTSPGGNDLSYNDATGTWTETDSYGFETEIEPSE